MTCKTCGDRGYVIEKRGIYEVLVPCHCAREERILRRLSEAGIPSRFWGFTLLSKAAGNRLAFKPVAGITKKQIAPSAHDLFEDTQASQLRAWKTCKMLFESYLRVFINGHRQSVRGRLIYGPCGVGKTHLAATLLTDLIYEGLSDVRFVAYPDLIRRIRLSYSGNGENEAQIMAPFATTKVLVLDDLGAEASENVAWVQSVIGYLLDQRYQAELPTLVTTNFPDPARKTSDGFKGQRELTLVDRIGTRLRSRLKEMCPLLTMPGLDLRDFLGRLNRSG